MTHFTWLRRTYHLEHQSREVSHSPSEYLFQSSHLKIHHSFELFLQSTQLRNSKICQCIQAITEIIIWYHEWNYWLPLLFVEEVLWWGCFLWKVPNLRPKKNFRHFETELQLKDGTLDHDFWLTAYPSTRISIATFPTLITFLTIRNLLISLFVSSSFGFWSFGLFRLKIRTSFSSFFNNFESTNSTRSDRPKSTQDWRTKWFDNWRRDCSTILRTLINYKNVVMQWYCTEPFSWQSTE